jgi:hypothetical protein
VRKVERLKKILYKDAIPLRDGIFVLRMIATLQTQRIKTEKMGLELSIFIKFRASFEMTKTIL